MRGSRATAASARNGEPGDPPVRRLSQPDLSEPDAHAISGRSASHYIEGLDTSVVAPLHAGDVERLGVLSIDVMIEDTASVLVLSELAFIPTSRLRGRVGSLVGYEDDIRRALDRLFTGF